MELDESWKKLEEWRKRFWLLLILLTPSVVFGLLWGFCLIKSQIFILAIQTIILGVTAIIIYQYTSEMKRQNELSRMNQNFKFLMDLAIKFDEIGEARSNVLVGKDNFEDRTKLCFYLDTIGHLIYQLIKQDKKQMDVALGHFAENYIRYWIRLEEFVNEKRKHSVGRDYCHFEWLAYRSFKFHKDRFPSLKIKFYKVTETGYFQTIKGEDDLISEYDKKFGSADQVERNFIQGNIS